MLTFPNAKINLGLHITSKRSDGYHDIESCFYPIPLKEALEIIPSEKLKFTSTGIPIPGSKEANLVIRAYELLKKDFNLDPVEIILHKNIPMGAGMGGGSADGAFMLKLLNDYFSLNISHEQLEKYALDLGSDCPFFIDNRPKLVRGRGEHFSTTAVDLSGYLLGLVFPNIHISTAEAYDGIKPAQAALPIKEILENHDISEWNNLLKNDFEYAIFKRYPMLQDIKKQLYESGALYASMTGSGSTIFALFDSEIQKDQVAHVDRWLSL